MCAFFDKFLSRCNTPEFFLTYVSCGKKIEHMWTHMGTAFVMFLDTPEFMLFHEFMSEIINFVNLAFFIKYIIYDHPHSPSPRADSAHTAKEPVAPSN